MSDFLTEADRSVSQVADTGRRWRFSRKQKTMMVLGGTAAVVGFVFWQNPGQKPDTPAPPEAARIGQVAAYEPPPVPRPAPIVAVPPPVPALTPAFRPQLFAPKQEKHAGGFMSFAVQESAPAAGPPGGTPRADPGAPYPINFKNQTFPGACTGPAVDPTFMLMPGLYHCTLDTAIASNIAGAFQCHTTQPITSRAGVVLMGAGTKIWGDYKPATGANEGRLVSASATALTPDDVFVPLDGPAADGLGRTGIPGNEDDHVFQRFGGAVLLSLSDSVTSVLSAALSKQNSTYLTFNSGNVSSLADEILQNTVNIPPTITVWQGTDIAIWIRYPIDFSASYRLRSINDAR